VGFFSKLVDKVTGGAADVTMEAPDAVARGTTMTVTATVVVDDRDIDVEAVAVELQCLVPEAAIDTNLTDGIVPPPNLRPIRSDEVRVAEAGTLAAGSRHEYTANFELPADAPTSSDDRTWMVRTVVRMPGNDPDSRWKVIRITE